MGQDAAGTGAIIEIEEPPAVADRRLAHLQRELCIREREERAARREMARLTEQLMRHSRGARLQLERARAEGVAEVGRLRAEGAAELERLRMRGAAQLEQARGELGRERAGWEAARAELERAAGGLERAESELGALRRQLEASERGRAREASEYGARVRQLEQSVSALSVGLRQTREDIERAAASRAWRLGHRVTRTLARLARRPARTEGALVAALARIDRVQGAVRALPAGDAGAAADPPAPDFGPPTLTTPASGSADGVRRAALAARLRERLGPAPEREEWPLVSAIVPTRNGLHHLQRLLPGLIEHTSYPALELIVVDNASSDGTLEYLDSLETPFALHVLANEDNLSYSEANARGAAQAQGELLLFLNNDIEPFEPGWLKELVCALDSDGVEAVGATLLHPEDLDRPGEEEQPLVQHRAIRFRRQDDMVKGFNHGDGEILWEGVFGTDTRAPAVTAACMLIARESFERVGGFGGAYRYGTEDVDLGLKLLVGGGECAGAGRAVLYHRESSTQNRASSDFRRLNRLENRRLFLECWGPQVRREYRLARLSRDPFWVGGGHADGGIAGARGGGGGVTSALGGAGAHVAITLTSLDVGDGWGDWYSGHEIGDALEGIGWRVSYVQRKGEQWYELPEDLDYVLSLMDPFDLRRVPEHVTTIAWIRNWTERWLERPWFERADVLLASSQGTAELIQARTGRATIRFPLAVNPARFHPRAPAERFAADYVFTGNWWGKDRDIQRRSGAARGGAPGDLRQGLGAGARVRALRPRRAALRGACAALSQREAGARRHPGSDAALRRAQRARVRRARQRHAADHQLRGRRARAVRRGLPRVALARDPARGAG